MRIRWRRLAAAAFAIGLLPTPPATASAGPSAPAPVIFVHGHQGSAQQFQSNAKRLEINGYDTGPMFAYEYDTSVADNAAAIEGLDAFVDEVLAETGATQVDLIAHSRGTTVSHAYLATPERAAEIRRYVNLDGRSADAQPGGVPTLALWGSLQPEGAIDGARNVYLTDLGHTETATSAESFTEIYRFLTGRRPWTTSIVPEAPGRVEISGRATLFPQNSGAPGTLEVWRVDPRSGARAAERPSHSVQVGADGSFGPLRVVGGQYYELVLVREGELTYHFYLEPFRRSDRFVRLQVSGPGGIGDYVDRCAGHTTLTVVRQREWWADQPGSNDRLSFGGVNVMTPALSPSQRQVLAMFAFDKNCDGRSDLTAPPPPFDALPFLSAGDVHLAAGADPIVVREVARGTGARTSLALRPWPSDQHSVTLQLHDW